MRYHSYNQLHPRFLRCISASLSNRNIHSPVYYLRAYVPNYDLYRTQCFWYASPIWEAASRLFPGCRETIHDNGRSTYLDLKAGATNGGWDVCREYCAEWSRVQRKTEQEREAEEAERQQLQLESLDKDPAEDRAEAQATIDQLLVRLARLERPYRWWLVCGNSFVEIV